jgi:hypothetical protein
MRQITRVASIVAVLVMLPIAVFAQTAGWTESGTSTYTFDKVGIGTTAPGAPLDINNGVTLSLKTSGYAVAAGGWYTPFSNAGMNGDGTGRLWFRAGGVDGRVVIDTNGNVGIGTNPAAANRLEVGGAAAVSGTLVAGIGVSAGGWYTTTAQSAGINSDTTGKLWVRAGGIDGRIVVDTNGNVGIGMNPGAANKLEVNGTIKGTTVYGAVYQAPNQDLAEWVPTTGEMAAGTVVVVDVEARNGVEPSTHAYDTRVAGVVSAQPGVLLGIEGPSKAKIATTGRVRVRVDASRAPIHTGDLLVTSDRAGIAMRSQPVDLGGVQFHRPGTLIGKALEPLADGEGEILVLLSLQ